MAKKNNQQAEQRKVGGRDQRFMDRVAKDGGESERDREARNKRALARFVALPNDERGNVKAAVKGKSAMTKDELAAAQERAVKAVTTKPAKQAVRRLLKHGLV